MPLLRALNYTSFCSYRYYSIAASSNLRLRLQNEIKTAMKNRDTNTSMTLRLVMSEINSAEKAEKDELSSSAIAGIIRKAIQRRAEAALKFSEASRPDLAEKERKEAQVLSGFLPPLLSSTNIDAHMKAIVDNLPAGTDPRKSLGLIFKKFYSKVDKSTVDANLVKQRALELINSISQ